MIDIYTEKKESKDWILQNDLYFNLNTGNEEMSENEIKLIQQVDEAKLTPDKHIETKYGLGTIRNLSSGCKTLLNIVKHPDKVVCVEECGPNVLKFIFAMDDIKIYMSRPTLAEIPDDVEIRFNDKVTVLICLRRMHIVSATLTTSRCLSTMWKRRRLDLHTTHSLCHRAA